MDTLHISKREKLPLSHLGRPLCMSKLEVVKQEMARVNIDILGISELRWTEMGEFKSEDHYIYYCGQAPYYYGEVRAHS